MASLKQIREALAKVVFANMPTDSDFYTYAQMTDMPTTPCMIVEPVETDFAVTFNRGTDCWYLMLYVLCSRQDTETAQLELDEYISGDGPKSIRRIINDSEDLGLPDTQAFVTGMKGYGGSFEANRTPMVGAVLTVKVNTDGRA